MTDNPLTWLAPGDISWPLAGRSTPLPDLLTALTQTGGGLGESLAVTGRIAPDDPESWWEQWRGEAHRNLARAEYALARNSRTSASQGYLRAVAQGAAAERGLRLLPTDDRRREAAAFIRDAFRRAMPLLAPRTGEVLVPLNGSRLPGYLLHPKKRGKSPLAWITLGAGSFAEEGFGLLGQALLDRGFAVLLLDGPGQGRSLRENGLPLRPDWETVARAVAAHARHFPGIRRDRICVLGRGLGGHLALRAATREEISAVVCDPPLHGVHSWLAAGLPPDGRPALWSGHPPGSAPARHALDWLAETLGADDPAALPAALDAYTLDGQQRAAADALLVTPEEMADQARRTADILGPKARIVPFTHDEGAGPDPLALAPHLFHARVTDTLADLVR
ncbi:alpha/beta hydrolase family protein [Desulfohalovibrio reitneri]|uniref:alpha/beta hydrolase family protein n=1 Tax=Desulfohalovibrio reitneri TaxID=1307759 RepID=UPI00137897E3|nr:alpha/beta hydrolase [Desulfohalovibrio reitneri]